jgi:SAM-dependent methyltransferase
VHEKLAQLSERKKDTLEKFGNVIIIEEDKAVKFEPNLFDVIVGGGVLNYVGDPEKLLTNLHDALRKNGHVAFALTDSWTHPAPIKLKNPEKIEKVCKDAGTNFDMHRGYFNTESWYRRRRYSSY